MSITSSELNKSKVIKEFIARFHGVRGTLPTPGKLTLKYGGNTSCIEIISEESKDNYSIFLDAGTGIVNGGDAAFLMGIRRFHIFISHFHYDHIIGLTKFTPLFKKECEIYIYATPPPNNTLASLIKRFFSHPFFPVEFNLIQEGAKINFIEVNEESKITIDSLNFSFLELNHPQGANAIKVQLINQDCSLILATDHEEGSEKDKKLEEFIKDTDALIIDSSYATSEFKPGWGHSTATFCAKLAKQANVKQLLLYHHEPQKSDTNLEKNILPEAQYYFKNTILSREGYEIKIKSSIKKDAKNSAIFRKINKKT